MNPYLKIYASNNLSLHRMRYAALAKAGYNPKWYAKYYGKTEVHFIVIEKQDNGSI